ncbi:rapid alkalinization factor-like [Andrographis paniculata]|uniref:rapid alkalinization factor-like n=1 Tax=Andrographis paniculata TaxID=175694 RepID=UPI0021E96CD1|nr:rapid alkalinization factor-like [Andrographis paniculata]
MGKLLVFRLRISALVAFIFFITTACAGDDVSWMPIGGKAEVCQGSVAECMADGVDEFDFDMDSESNRRILATTKYISYGALQANNVPCSRRGASYYNCRPGAQANPYTRSCSAATQCRS